MTRPGDVWVDLAHSTIKYDDGAQVREMAGNMVPAAQFGVFPDTGADMTIPLQAAFDNCPVGGTLVIWPGRYLISDGIDYSRSHSLYAIGAILDLGSNVPADGYAFRIGSTTMNVSRLNILGLKVQRTVVYTGSPSGAASTAFLYDGIRYVGLTNCLIHDVWALGFEKGHRFTGMQASSLGIAYDDIYRLLASECRYAIWIENGNSAGTSGGYANEINFFGGRTLINTNASIDKHVTDPANFQALHIDYPGGGTVSGSIPNNIRLYGVSLEGAWGRKVFSRGEDIYLHECRYEFPNGGTDLEIEKVIDGGTGRRTFFIGGQGLDSSVLTITDTYGGATPPQYNAKLAISHQDYSGGLYPAVNTDLTCADLKAETGQFFNRASAANPSVTISDVTGATARIKHQASVSDGTTNLYGGFEVMDNAGNLVNAIGCATSESMPSASKPVFIRRGLIINKEAGNYDSRVGGDTDPNLTYWDASADMVGIGTATPDSKVHVVGKIHGSDELEVDGALNHDGTAIGFYGSTPAGQSTGWSVTNDTTDKSYDADATSVDELADVLATLINHLKTIGILGA